MPFPLFGSKTNKYNNDDNKNEVYSFKAGRMFLENGWVKPDSEKGKIEITEKYSIVTLSWINRTSNKNEFDIIIYPSKAIIKRITQCTTGRVYLLTFKDNTNIKFFFWMQEPNETKDSFIYQQLLAIIATGKLPQKAKNDEIFQMLGAVKNMSHQDINKALSELSTPELFGLLMNLSQIKTVHATSSHKKELTLHPPDAKLKVIMTTNKTSLPKKQLYERNESDSDSGTVKLANNLMTYLSSNKYIGIFADKNIQTVLLTFLPSGTEISTCVDDVRATLNTQVFHRLVRAFTLAVKTKKFNTDHFIEHNFTPKCIAAIKDGNVKALLQAFELDWTTSDQSNEHVKSESDESDENNNLKNKANLNNCNNKSAASTSQLFLLKVLEPVITCKNSVQQGLITLVCHSKIQTFALPHLKSKIVFPKNKEMCKDVAFLPCLIEIIDCFLDALASRTSALNEDLWHELNYLKNNYSTVADALKACNIVLEDLKQSPQEIFAQKLMAEFFAYDFALINKRNHLIVAKNIEHKVVQNKEQPDKIIWEFFIGFLSTVKNEHLDKKQFDESINSKPIYQLISLHKKLSFVNPLKSKKNTKHKKYHITKSSRRMVKNETCYDKSESHCTNFLTLYTIMSDQKILPMLSCSLTQKRISEHLPHNVVMPTSANTLIEICKTPTVVKVVTAVQSCLQTKDIYPELISNIYASSTHKDKDEDEINKEKKEDIAKQLSVFLGVENTSSHLLLDWILKSEKFERILIEPNVTEKLMNVNNTLHPISYPQDIEQLTVLRKMPTQYSILVRNLMQAITSSIILSSDLQNLSLCQAALDAVDQHNIDDFTDALIYQLCKELRNNFNTDS